MKVNSVDFCRRGKAQSRVAKTYSQAGFVFGEKLFAFVGSRVTPEVFWISCKALYSSKEGSSNLLSLYHFKKHVSYFLDRGLALVYGVR